MAKPTQTAKGVQILRRYGAENIKPYVLVNNYGYTFDLNGTNHDIRFWANCYGCYIGEWSCNDKEIQETFNTEIGASCEW